MTYLTIVNNILKRLRERTVSTVDENAYSTLIGMIVNDAKQDVENAWDWSALRTTLTATTSADVFNYELNESQNRIKVLDVVNDTSNWFMQYREAHKFNDWFLNSTPQKGEPLYYSFNGVSNDGDTQVEFYPIPDKAYDIRFNVVLRPADLVNDTDKLEVPSRAIELLAYAKAIEERGEDGAVSAQSAYATAERALNDAIALDAARHPEETIWYTV